MNTIQRLIQDESGATAIEYGLFIIMAAVGIGGAVLGIFLGYKLLMM